MQTTEELISITDPGEKDRAEHNMGDRVVVRISNVFAWLFPILMIAICSQVILRSSGFNQAWLDDLQWWLYGSSALIAIGYAVTTDSHVRVDIFHEHFSDRKKQRIEVFALVWLFLPFIILCWDVTLDYAISSVVIDEGSDSPNGLHNLWILKVFMNFAFLFIGVAIWSTYVRFLAKMTRPALWKQLLFAFPSTVFILNLIAYYGIFYFIRLTNDPEVLSSRDITRMPIFGTFEIGPEEMKWTVLIAFVLTAIVIVVARLFDRGERAEG